MSKTTTVVEEYDKDGKLIKKTTTITEGEKEIVNVPVYPTYPYSPSTGDPWWQNPVTYVTNSTTTIDNVESLAQSISEKLPEKILSSLRKD